MAYAHTAGGRAFQAFKQSIKVIDLKSKMIIYSRAITLQGRNIDFKEFPNVKRWLDEIGERPALSVPCRGRQP
jgi:hypothetical protein